MTASCTEVELKLAIRDRDDFDRFLAVLPRPEAIRIQWNLYLDTTGGALSRAGLSLRLRAIAPDGAVPAGTPLEPAMTGRFADPATIFRFTLKSGRGRRGACHQAEETEADSDPVSARRWLAGLAPLVLPGDAGCASIPGILDGQPVVVTTWSLTRRLVVPVGDGFAIEADETCFPDGYTDFELEVEHPDPDAAARILGDLGRSAGVDLVPSPATKHGRARTHATGHGI